jgi:transglutaminase-like putative cysteine protease
MIYVRLPAPAPAVRVVNNPVQPWNIRATGNTGRTDYLPLNPSRSDEWTIIANLQRVVDVYGREPALRALALRLAPPAGDMDVTRQCGIIFDWVKRNMVYQPDPAGSELVQTPARLLGIIQQGGRAPGDCDDHVVLLGSLLVALGIPARVAGVKINGAAWFNHVIIMVRLDGVWKDLDPCVKSGPQPIYGERLASGI